MILIYGLGSIVLFTALVLYIILSGTKCPVCGKGKLSRDLTGYGKKAECTYCHECFDVEWL